VTGKTYERTVPSGRFIAESATPQTLLVASSVPMEYVPSPYADHRSGYLHNESALVEMKPEWDTRLAGLSWIRNNFFRGISQPPVRASLDELDQMARIAMVMPKFLQNRAENPYPAEGAIPDVVGDMTKLAAGVVTTTTKLRKDGYDPDSRDLTGDAAYKYIDNRQLLIGDHGHACPATPGMIKRGFEVLISDKNHLPDSGFDDYFPNFHSLNSFSTAYRGFLSVKNLINGMLSKIDSGDHQRRRAVITQMLPTIQQKQNGLYVALGYDPQYPVLTMEEAQSFFRNNN